MILFIYAHLFEGFLFICLIPRQIIEDCQTFVSNGIKCLCGSSYVRWAELVEAVSYLWIPRQGWHIPARKAPTPQAHQPRASPAGRRGRDRGHSRRYFAPWHESERGSDNAGGCMPCHAIAQVAAVPSSECQVLHDANVRAGTWDTHSVWFRTRMDWVQWGFNKKLFHATLIACIFRCWVILGMFLDG